MADSNIGGGGTDILVPESELGKIDVVDLNFIVDGEEISGKEVAIGAPVTAVTTKVDGGNNVVYAGKAQKDSTIVIKKSDDTSIVSLRNSLNEDVEVKTKKGTTVDFKVAEGKFRRSEFTAGKGRQKDTVEVGSSAKLINAEFDLKKGGDTFTLTGGATLKKTNTVDLGQGGKDVVTVGNDVNAKGKAKLVIENMDDKDTLNYGGESYSLSDIQNGDADLPSFLELG